MASVTAWYVKNGGVIVDRGVAGVASFRGQRRVAENVSDVSYNFDGVAATGVAAAARVSAADVMCILPRGEYLLYLHLPSYERKAGASPSTRAFATRASRGAARRLPSLSRSK